MPFRYYVWHEQGGWRLRSASRKGRTTRFTGSIKLIDGTFGKLRPIGLERKGKRNDEWQINAGRTEIRFEINTAGSFDGFDFDVRGRDASIEFELFFRDGRKMPKRIFIGGDGAHPKMNKFQLPAQPNLRRATPDPTGASCGTVS